MLKISTPNNEGNEHALFQEIIDHRSDHNALKSGDLMSQTGDPKNPKPRRTTKGWDLCVQWFDGSTSWILFKEMKKANTVEMAKCTKSKAFAEDMEFA